MDRLKEEKEALQKEKDKLRRMEENKIERLKEELRQVWSVALTNPLETKGEIGGLRQTVLGAQGARKRVWPAARKT